MKKATKSVSRVGLTAPLRDELDALAIMKGLEDSARGRLVDHEEVEAWLETWGRKGSGKPAR